MNIVQKSSAGRIADTPTFVLTTETPDRVGDIVMLKGLDTKHFEQNPVALVHHRMGEFPVGVWKNLRRHGDALLGDLSLAAKGISPQADLAAALIDAGILRAVSVTFAPIESVKLEPKGYRFNKAELLEVSLVSVPMNPRAVRVAKSLGMSDDQIQDFFTDPVVKVPGSDDDAGVSGANSALAIARAKSAIIAAKRAALR